MYPFKDTQAISCNFLLKTISLTFWALLHCFTATAFMYEYEGTELEKFDCEDVDSGLTESNGFVIDELDSNSVSIGSGIFHKAKLVSREPDTKNSSSNHARAKTQSW